MAIVSRQELKAKLTAGELVFEPTLDQWQLQPSAIDLRVGWSFYIPQSWEYTDAGRVALVADYMNLEQQQENFKLIKLKPGQYFEILPHEFIIIATLEKVSLRGANLIAMLHPRSSTLRRGLLMEGGKVDSQYSGHLTIPISNTTNHIVRLYPGERLCQLVVHELSANLSPEEAQQHGAQLAKYQDATAYGLNYRGDSSDEVAHIRRGTIEELKSAYPIKD